MGINKIDACIHHNYQPKSTRKKVAKAVILTAAAAGTVLSLAKNGKLKANPEGNKAIEVVKKGLRKFATPVLIGYEIAKANIKNSVLGEKAANLLNTVFSKTKGATNIVKEGFESAKNTVVDGFKKAGDAIKLNKEYFAAKKAACGDSLFTQIKNTVSEKFSAILGKIHK